MFLNLPVHSIGVVSCYSKGPLTRAILPWVFSAFLHFYEQNFLLDNLLESCIKLQVLGVSVRMKHLAKTSGETALLNRICKWTIKEIILAKTLIQKSELPCSNLSLQS
jgi:hypothetical protein